MIKLDVFDGKKTNSWPNHVYFMVEDCLYYVVIFNAPIDQQYQFLRELPEYAIINLLKQEFRRTTRFLHAVLTELELLDSLSKTLISLGSIGICDWKFQTLDQVRLILHTLTMIDYKALSLDQIKQFVMDQTGLDL